MFSKWETDRNFWSNNSLSCSYDCKIPVQSDSLAVVKTLLSYGMPLDILSSLKDSACRHLNL